jgi:hypothetical protein
MGLLRMLFADVEEDGERMKESNVDLTDDSAWDADAMDQDILDLSSSSRTDADYDPVQALRVAQEREAAEARQRDELAARVGRLSLAIESLLRLLKAKGVINDLDLRNMELQIDTEDGEADGEYHPDAPRIPSHCPRCEARMPAGKRICQLCGHGVAIE